jgi:signal-transduction protein with cAMP-binding, CBS, and nucleotidyltransferase domain
MRDNHVGSLVVIKDNEGRAEPAGIVTDRDIVIELIAKAVPVEDVTVGDIMSFALLKVTEDETVFDTAQRMRCRGVRRVPVVTKTGELAGILALDDIMSLLGEELSMLSKLTQRETEQEAKKRTQPC